MPEVHSQQYESDSSSEVAPPPPPPPRIPGVIANWWLNENLGAGYSGILQASWIWRLVHKLTLLMILGSIFRATHLYNGQVVALKVQYIHHECPTNAYERHVYPLIQGGVGMPKLYAAGIQGEWDFLAIDLLGPSLDNLHRRSGKDTMDMRSVCAIAIQVVRSHSFHPAGFW